MSARDRILGKLSSSAPRTPLPQPDVAAWYARHRPVESQAQKVQRFRQCIELAHAEVHSVTEANWLSTLATILRAKRLNRLLVSAETSHGCAALEELPPQGIECPVYAEPIESWKSELFHDMPASLTAARGAVAETGTLILWPSPAEPRLMSLVPPVHIVLLEASRIYNTFFEAMSTEGWVSLSPNPSPELGEGRVVGRLRDRMVSHLPTNSLLISGPSKTADIQQTLAYGAHGPKELVVLLMETADDNAELERAFQAHQGGAQ